MAYLWAMERYALFCFFLLIFSGISAQQLSKVDFTHLKAELNVHPLEKEVTGELIFTFDILEETDSIFIDAQKMEFDNVEFNSEKIDFLNDGERLWILSDFKKSVNNKLSLTYAARPGQAMYFVGWKVDTSDLKEGERYDPQVWTQGQGKYTSHWLPSFDDVNEKLEFDLSIKFKKGFAVIANGNLLDANEVDTHFTRWEYDMTKPMSSYLVALAIGKYYKEDITSSSGIPVELYYYQDKEETVEHTYRYTQRIFDFFEEEIGVAYPWQNYKQVPVRDFLYSGMENTGTTIFSDAFVTDSIGFIDRNYIMVNAHELAHQWFGNMVTAVSGEHHWLQEGFSTYYALLAEREIFGEDYYYFKLFEFAQQLKELSDEGKGEALLTFKGSSLTYYQKGAWVLHILRERVGEEAFKQGVRNYLNKHQYKNVSTADFITEVEEASGEDLTGFVAQWLEQSAFSGTEALNSLKKSDFIKNYLEIAALKGLPLHSKRELLERALEFPVNEYVGQEVIYQISLEEPSEVMELYKKAFNTNNIFVRQAIAASMEKIPGDLKGRYEFLLEDDSYLTKEAAFYHLWMNFPQDRNKYLDKLKKTDGFLDKNIRILWLALNLATPDYESEHQKEVYQELSGYTATVYPFQVRQKAFEYLFQLNSFSKQNLKDLLQGSQHHVYRFQSFSREMITDLLKNEVYEKRFKSLMGESPAAQRKFLERLLEQ